MSERSKILVVDDTPANLEVITQTLGSAGYGVSTAISGDRALKRLQTVTPDLILLDIQMPGIDGFETCRQIKANPDTATIPIIFITALADINSITKAFELGAVDYINKPFQEAELLSRVKTHLQLQSLTRNLEQQVQNRTAELETTLEELMRSRQHIQQQMAAVFQLSTSPNISAGKLDLAFQEITEITATALNVEQVGIWLFEGDRTQLKCVDLFERSTHNHTQGIELFQQDNPIYFDAIATQPLLAVNDAQNDPRTREFTENYLIPLQITALLDASIQTDGEINGVLCCEHAYTRRIWTEAEQTFARSMANLVMLAMESQRRHQKNQKLKQTLATLKTTQLQMVQNEKMATLGNLVAGVAHEINNPIGFLNGSISNARDYIQDLFEHLEIYQQQQPPCETVCEHAEDIDLAFLQEDLPKLLTSMQKATDRIKGISTSLRTFSRADTEYKVSTDLHEGIDSTLLILKYRLKARDKRPEITILKDYGDLPPVECYPGQLNQVFMNILANAIDIFDEMALQSTYSALEAHKPQITLKTAFLPPENAVEVQIQDNGKGMSEEIQAQIFKHLFTTKAVGKGTGLGLAIARQIIIEKHNGNISCSSKLGLGTTFTLTLPVNSYSNRQSN